MYFQPSADSFGIRILGGRYSWWHSRQANDAVASQRSIFSENQDLKSFFGVALKTTNRETGRRTDTRDNYSNPRCACAPRVNEGLISLIKLLAFNVY